MIKNVLLLCVSIFVTILAFEVALNFYSNILPSTVQNNLIWARTETAHYFSPKFLVRDRELGWYFRPNVDVLVTDGTGTYSLKTVSVNAQDRYGFRDDGIERPVYAIAVGDSFTDGWSIEAEKNWVELLEQDLQRDVVNMGVRGWSSIHYSRMVQKYATELQPEVVLWAFFINDLYETGIHSRLLDEQRSESNLDKVAHVLQNRSALWELYRYARQSGPYMPSPNIEKLPPYSIDGLDITLYPKTWKDIVDLSTADVQAGLLETKKLLLDTHTLLDANGTQLIVVFFPAAEQTYSPYLAHNLSPNDFREALGEDNLAYLDQPSALLLEFCAEQKLTCLDLLPEFRAAASEGQTLYVENDQHLNEIGNLLAKTIILQQMR